LTCISWDSLNTNVSGVHIGYNNKPWEDYRSIYLQSICCWLAVCGIKNSKKAEIIEAIVTTSSNKNAYSSVKHHFQPNNSPRKEIQCMYCLMNVLFSNKSCDEFLSIGNSVTRVGLDTGKCANNEIFWRKVVSAFTCNLDVEYSTLLFTNDDVFTGELIDPGKVVNHQWKKIRSMWKVLIAKYNQEITPYTQSGTYNENFYALCREKKTFITYVVG
jgi:hypothetical protein